MHLVALSTAMSWRCRELGETGHQLLVESCFLGINKPECPPPQCREPPEMSGAARLGCFLPTCLFPAHTIPRDRLTAFLGLTVGSGGHSGTGVVTLQAPPSSAAATLAWVSVACVTLHRKHGEWLNPITRKSGFQSFNPMKVIPGYLGMLWEEKEEECVRPPSRQPGRAEAKSRTRLALGSLQTLCSPPGAGEESSRSEEPRPRSRDEASKPSGAHAVLAALLTAEAAATGSEADHVQRAC
ncbi:unnamed protein product [Rangifer tarandus platyrhynchus]|uniref:Uncharacterized protein n=2 Tax=Rangifer tarandus platyrhynchus TaxID=3082113 RepID=A0ABN8XWN7_RANTA|nr:unnamed protein product [Rangifer tarandus platyrhynchus]CAI9692562.1 unnamed protein product [Rangifer tarandus platyrhynchus]